MNIRITDSALAATNASRIGANRLRVDQAQEQVSSGKRINRPSDDPFGTGVVLKMRTSQANIEQFQQNAATVGDGLQTSDSALESYEQMLDRGRSLLTQGASDSTTPAQKLSIATEMDSLRQSMLSIANGRGADRY